jgi:hypothetical protein
VRGQVRQRWVDPVLVPIALLGASIAAHLLAVWTQIRITPGQTVAHLLVKWDGGIYLRLAQYGYPRHLPVGSGARAQSTLGFYPLYSLLVRGVVDVTSWSYITAGLFVAIAASAGAVVVIRRLAERLCGPEIADRSVALFVFAPGAIVLSMSYSEPLFLLLSASCLLALLDDRWEVAGALAFLACLTRPNGLALVAACAAAAFVALAADRRRLRALVAPGLAIAGFLVLPIYQRIHTGDFLAYWKTQHRGWGQGFDFGWNTLHESAGVLAHPFRDFNLLMSFLGVVVIVVGVILLVRWRPPVPVTAYTAVIVVLALGSSQLVSTFRFALTAFPLGIAYARVIRGSAFAAAIAVSAVLFAVAAGAATSVIYTP